MMVSDKDAKIERGAFDAIAALAHREFGLHIAPEKMKMVQSRLRHRLSELGLEDFDAYSALVCSSDGNDERRHMVSALTTNVSHFFREPHHFELLSKYMMPNLRSGIGKSDRVRIWSAGCSNGQEPYSIVMHLLREEPSLASRDFKVLATDVDPKVIAFATQGEYAARQATGISGQDKSAFTTEDGDMIAVSEHVRSLITFRELNLLSRWPMRHQFDVIFCRNVVIYFDLETQEELWRRFHQVLKPRGLLFLGHSERVAAPAKFGFTTIGTTAYQKSDDQMLASSFASGGQYGTS